LSARSRGCLERPRVLRQRDGRQATEKKNGEK
jgi:hypothetical protein